MKKACCAFTGYRPQKLPYGNDESHPDCIKLKHRLMEEINNHIDKGIRTFITGMALGVDQWAAEIVLKAKETRPHDGIKLWCAIPYDKQASAWTEKEQARYYAIINHADLVTHVSRQYYNGCLLARNRHMIAASTHLIAVYDGQAGGTAYTIRYAQQNGLVITTLKP